MKIIGRTLPACVFGSFTMFMQCAAYGTEWSTAGSRPEVNRRAIAGIWKLTPETMIRRPMKEFTVYPKKIQDLTEEEPQILLMLKEDGSFKQYEKDSDQNLDIDNSWNDYQIKKQVSLQNFLSGTWDFLDGQLILAADRYKKLMDDKARPTTDTLLSGSVVANYQVRLQDNPVLSNDAGSGQTSNHTSLDTHLSVPNGSIDIGRFFYPRNHPSFFEQPMFKPERKGAFNLKQILGTLNTAKEERKIVERFQRSNFYNKTFFLTSQPIGQKNAAAVEKLNRYKKGKRKIKEPNDQCADIRVIQVRFHANNTFSTEAGLGTAAILRGKFDIIGQAKDQLWMQVVRFGFGRSVSGSVYSEGRMLSHEDAKAYWGTIDDSDDELAVKGSVLDGWGLEPLPVAQFIMREINDSNVDEEYEDEDDVEQSMEDSMNNDIGIEDIGIDWSSDDKGFE